MPKPDGTTHLVFTPMALLERLARLGWREDKKRAWLWMAVTSIAIVFQLARGRGKAVVREMLGENFLGRLVTDRWNAYHRVDVVRRQLCWSHLLRDFEGMVERGGVGGGLAQKLLDETTRMSGGRRCATGP